MKVKLSRDRVRKLINQYYREVLGIEGKAIFSLSKDYVGYGSSEHLDCVLNITYVGKTKILGEDTSITIDVSDEELKNIISYYLEKEGHSLSNIEIDSGLDYKTEGYGMGECTVSYPCFRGVNVNIKDNVKKIGEKK